MKNPIKRVWHWYRTKRIEETAHKTMERSCFSSLHEYNKEHPYQPARSTLDRKEGKGSDGGSV